MKTAHIEGATDIFNEGYGQALNDIRKAIKEKKIHSLVSLMEWMEK
jgi:hypothetical protein